jgi:hypothetical protein
LRGRADALVNSGNAQKNMIGVTLLTLIDDARDPRRVTAQVDRVKRVIATLPTTQNDALKHKELVNWLAPAATLDDIGATVLSLPQDNPFREPALRTVTSVRANFDNSVHDLAVVRSNVEQWFDHGMERVSGVYKRRTIEVLLYIAIVVTVLTGADTVRIVNSLYMNPTLRTAIAEQAVAQTSPGLGALVRLLPPLSTMFGYADMPSLVSPDLPSWLVERVTGMTLTILAVSLGAPFWFQLLLKLVNVRGTGNPPSPAATSSPSPRQDRGADEISDQGLTTPLG